MRWDKTLEKIVGEICNEQGLDEDMVKEAIETSIKCIHTAMEMDEMPKVRLRGLGTLKLIPRRLEKRIEGEPLKNPEQEERRLQNIERFKRILNRINKEDEKVRRAKKRK